MYQDAAAIIAESAATRLGREIMFDSTSYIPGTNSRSVGQNVTGAHGKNIKTIIPLYHYKIEFSRVKCCSIRRADDGAELSSHFGKDIRGLYIKF